MRQVSIAVAVGALILAAAEAKAADIARPVYKAPPPVPVYSWSGWYGGISGGYGWGDPTAQVDPSTAPLPPSTQALSSFSAADPFTLHSRPTGGFGGLLLGYNAQFQTYVLGWEADFSFAAIRDTANGSFTNFAVFDTDTGSTNALVSLETKLDWFGTVRGRWGVLVGPALPYVTGGFAYGHLKNTATSSATQILNGASAGGYSQSATFNDTQFGFAVGGGIDWLIVNNWLLRGEYLFIKLEGKDHVPNLPAITLVNTDYEMHIVRAALVFKLAP